MEIEKEPRIPIWSIIIVILFGAMSWYSADYEIDFLGAVVAISMNVMAVQWCYKLCSKIKSNRAIALWVGILFSIVGLFFYWASFKKRTVGIINKDKILKLNNWVYIVILTFILSTVFVGYIFYQLNVPYDKDLELVNEILIEYECETFCLENIYATQYEVFYGDWIVCYCYDEEGNYLEGKRIMLDSED